MFLHANFWHLFWNVISFFFIGFQIEKAINDTKKYILLLVIGSIGGNIFSAVVAPYALGVGSSTSLFAVLGVLFLWFYLNFYRLGPYRYQYLVFFGIMVGFALLNGLLQPGGTVDSFGHIGGLIVGMSLSIFLVKGIDEG